MGACGVVGAFDGWEFVTSFGVGRELGVLFVAGSVCVGV